MLDLSWFVLRLSIETAVLPWTVLVLVTIAFLALYLFVSAERDS